MITPEFPDLPLASLIVQQPCATHSCNVSSTTGLKMISKVKTSKCRGSAYIVQSSRAGALKRDWPYLLDVDRRFDNNDIYALSSTSLAGSGNKN